MWTLITGLIALAGAVYIFLLTPFQKEDANRRALHRLELFCPPSWNTYTVKQAREALSKLYRDLQYASRGKSFIITRAAAWEMKKIIDNIRPDDRTIDLEESKELYIWKTLIARLISRKEFLPEMFLSGKKFKGRLRKGVKYTNWVLDMYNKMNPDSIITGYADKLKNFKEQLCN